MVNLNYSLSQVTISISLKNFNKSRYIYKGSANEIDAALFFQWHIIFFYPDWLTKTGDCGELYNIVINWENIHGVLYACSCPLGIEIHCLAVWFLNCLLIWRTSTVFRFLDQDESFSIISPHCFSIYSIYLGLSWLMLAMATAA